ncbi:MAG: DUF2490 domain-containing protein [Janthinobacterium lividum]
MKQFFLFLLLAGLVGMGPAGAQPGSPAPARVWDANHNAWLCYFSDAKIYQRWGLHTEFQYRRTNGLRDPQQYFYRTGVNYAASEKVLLTAGYTYLLSLPYGDYPDPGRTGERRLYEKVEIDQAAGRLALAHRYIQDQRWLRPEGQAQFDFQHRSRYRLQAKFALTRPKIEPGALYALASDEIFVSYGPNAPGFFNQNRLYGGLGYRVAKALAVEVSYLNQVVAHDDQVVFEDNRTVQVALYFNPDFRPASQR